MTRTRIKICGITSVEHARVSIESGADALGFVFAGSSPRCIAPSDAWDIIQQLPPFVTTVGLTVNAPVDEYADIEQQCPTDFGQLHGTEDFALAQRCGPRIIKAIQFQADSIELDLRSWSDVEEVDAILIDGGRGGEGIALDWQRLRDVKSVCTKPIILAGGLTPENVAEAIRIVQPYAVDVSSGVERERGKKDRGLIRAFCEAVRRAP